MNTPCRAVSRAVAGFLVVHAAAAPALAQIAPAAADSAAIRAAVPDSGAVRVSLPDSAVVRVAAPDSVAVRPPAPDSAAIAAAEAARVAAEAARIAAEARACSGGEKSANESYNPIGFGIAGLLTWPGALAVAILKTPNPPPSALAGLPPEAAREYSRCYGRVAKKKNVQASLRGWAAGAILVLAAYWYSDSKTAP